MGDRLEWLRELREAKARRLEGEQGSVTHPQTVTKVRGNVTKVAPDVTKVRADVTAIEARGRMGRPRLGDVPMTAAERKRLQRERAKARPPRAD